VAVVSACCAGHADLGRAFVKPSYTALVSLNALGVEGSCLCGEVRFVVEGDAKGFFLCHCSRCRKGTGSAHAANVFFDSAQLQWLSGGDGVETFRLRSTRHTRSFCKSCGASLPYELQGTKVVVVPAGSIDSGLQLRPQAHVSCASRASWDRELEHLPQLDALPTG